MGQQLIETNKNLQNSYPNIDYSHLTPLLNDYNNSIWNQYISKVMSSIPPAQEIVMPSINNGNSIIANSPVNSTTANSIPQIPSLVQSSRNATLRRAEINALNNANKIQQDANKITQQYVDNQKNIGIANGVIGGLTSAVNMGLGIWGAIEQSKLNKEQIANMQAQREMWSEQISASREARTQRREELARLNKMRSNTKAQFNTQSRVSRSY